MVNMSEPYRRIWLKLCPRCDGQGRLFIQRNLLDGRLYLHCEECEYGFLDPEHCDRTSDGFLAMDTRFDLPNLDEIDAQGWRRFALREEI
jgi:hypothetical protein